MSVLAASLNSSLASVGLSAADAGQVAAVRDTLDKSVSQRSSPETDKKPEDASPRLSARARELSAAEQRRVSELKRIDAEVRAHEQAHINAGRGVITSGPNYTYTYGPDGKQYAIAGEVGIDTSAERKPEANIDKGQRIQSAALAPAQPSPQDYRVAAAGSQLETQGRNDLAEQIRAEQAAEAAAAEAERAAQSETTSPTATPEPDANKPPVSDTGTRLAEREPPDSPAATAQSSPAQTYAELSALGSRIDKPSQQVDLLV